MKKEMLIKWGLLGFIFSILVGCGIFKKSSVRIEFPANGQQYSYAQSAVIYVQLDDNDFEDTTITFSGHQQIQGLECISQENSPAFCTYTPGYGMVNYQPQVVIITAIRGDDRDVVSITFTSGATSSRY